MIQLNRLIRSCLMAPYFPSPEQLRLASYALRDVRDAFTATEYGGHCLYEKAFSVDSRGEEIVLKMYYENDVFNTVGFHVQGIRLRRLLSVLASEAVSQHLHQFELLFDENYTAGAMILNEQVVIGFGVRGPTSKRKKFFWTGLSTNAEALHDRALNTAFARQLFSEKHAVARPRRATALIKAIAMLSPARVVLG